MIRLKEILNETHPYIQKEIDKAKNIFVALEKMYPEIPKFSLEFKDLNGRSGGYLTTSKLRGGKHIFINKMTIDNSGMWGNDPDYSVCHEFAHAILATTKGTLAHNAAHAKLTYELAKKFGLV